MYISIIYFIFALASQSKCITLFISSHFSGIIYILHVYVSIPISQYNFDEELHQNHLPQYKSLCKCYKLKLWFKLWFSIVISLFPWFIFTLDIIIIFGNQISFGVANIHFRLNIHWISKYTNEIDVFYLIMITTHIQQLLEMSVTYLSKSISKMLPKWNWYS